ncbi:MAG TPA: amidase family protein, partial [Burkholderiaceae bacterium]|nr:amidase family protein [Burkholderiaceae bacterium]
MSQTALERLGVAELTRALASRQLSSVELTKHLLARITAHHRLGAFLHVNAERALAAAAHADRRRAQGDRGALLGVPIAHKDVFVTSDAPTTAGSKMLAGYASPFDATIVARLGAGVPGGAPGAGA